VLADRIFPGALDVVLKKTGYDGQVVDRPVPQGDNLWEPLPGDHGCHGSFDDKARPASRQEMLRYTPLGTGARIAGAVGRRVGGRILRHLV
jgi:hypothetical protein